jgi:hypothetical protein
VLGLRQASSSNDRCAILAILSANIAQAQSPTTSQATSGITVPNGRPVRLMVMDEVTSRTAHVGERFKLRVDADVNVGAVRVMPTGTTAWGEITLLEKNGAVGKSGNISARLLYIDLPSGPIPLRSDQSGRGDQNTADVVLAVFGFGLLGLFNRGNNAKLKAGDIFTGYIGN